MFRGYDHGFDPLSLTAHQNCGFKAHKQVLNYINMDTLGSNKFVPDSCLKHLLTSTMIKSDSPSKYVYHGS